MANNTETVTTSIYSLDTNFSGRPGPDFDETKMYQIHRRNRAYVWKLRDKIKLLESIRSGRYIPPIITVETIENGRTVRYVVDGGHRVTTFRHILRGDVTPITDEDRRIIERYPITVVVLRGLTSAQIREQFRVLQGGKKVTSGQLYAMSEDCPLVSSAIRLLYDTTHPLRAMINRNFFDTVNSVDSDTRKNLENAVAMVSGAMHGVSFITASFDKQEEVITSPVDENKVTQVLARVFEVFDMANAEVEQTDGRRRKGQWTLGTYIAPILYDLITNPDRQREVQEKWKKYIVRVRQGHPLAEEANNVGGANNINESKLRKIVMRVTVFVEENRLLTLDEIKQRLEAEDENASSDGEDEN